MSAYASGHDRGEVDADRFATGATARQIDRRYRIARETWAGAPTGDAFQDGYRAGFLAAMADHLTA